MSGSDETIKDTKSLFEEITNRNPNFQNISYILNILEKIKVLVYSKNMKSISEESLKKKIKELKAKFLSNPNNVDNYIELIAIMIKVNKKLFKYTPRQIQIIAVLFFLFKDKN